MIDKLYYYFIKTKYCDFTRPDILKLRDLHDKSRRIGITANTISNAKKSAIEVGLIGKELALNFRHVDNYILTNNFIINCFIEDELSYSSGMKRLAGEVYKT